MEKDSANKKDREKVSYLMPELWEIIFQKTNLWTCLTNERLKAAKTFLGCRIAKDAALRKAVKSGRLDHLQILVNELALESKDVRHAKWQTRNESLGTKAHKNVFHTEFELSLLELAILHGRLKVVEWLVRSNFDDTCSKQIVKHLLRHGPFAILRFLKEAKEEIFADLSRMDDLSHLTGWRAALYYSASGHQLKSVSLCLKQPCVESEDVQWAVGKASFHGRLKTVQLMLRKWPDCIDEEIALKAIARNQHHVLEWLAQTHKEVFTSDCAFVQSRIYSTPQSLKTLKFLHSSGLVANNFSEKFPDIYSCHPETISWLRKTYPDKEVKVNLGEELMEKNSLKRLRLLHQMGSFVLDYSSSFCWPMIIPGGLPIVEWATQTFGIECSADAQDLETMRFLHSSLKGRFTSKAVDHNAERGNLEIIQWLARQNLPRGTERAMHQAACSGHFEVVLWLHENGYNCSQETLGSELWKGDVKMAKWLWENRPEGCEPSAKVITDSGKNMSLETWLKTGAKEALDTLILFRAESPFWPDSVLEENIQCYSEGLKLQVTSRSQPSECERSILQLCETLICRLGMSPM